METLNLSLRDGVAEVELCRPESRNAFNVEMIDELSQVFADLSRDRGVFLTVLRGSGKAFCAGADLSYMQSMSRLSFEENVKDARKLDEMFWALRQLPVFVLVCVHGHVSGGGLGLMCLGDMVVADPETKMQFSEVKLGLSPAVISPYILEKSSHSVVKRWMMSAESFSSQQAHDVGIVDELVPISEHQRRVSSLAQELRFNGPDAMRATKTLLREQARLSLWEEVRDLTTQVIASRRMSGEGQEGIRSFLEKRSPSWRPK